MANPNLRAAVIEEADPLSLKAAVIELKPLVSLKAIVIEFFEGSNLAPIIEGGVKRAIVSGGILASRTNP